MWVGWSAVARRHHEVLQYAATTAAVPLRLPSLYGNLESLGDTLRAASDLLERDLRRIQGKAGVVRQGIPDRQGREVSGHNCFELLVATIYWRSHGISAPEARRGSSFESKYARYTTPLVRSVPNMCETGLRMPCCPAARNRCC